MPSTSISLPDYMDEWIKRNHNSLSKYVQNKISEDMKKNHQDDNTDQQKNLNISFMFIIVGIGFGLLGITFLSSGTTYLHSSILFLVIGTISFLYGLIWLNAARIKRNGKKRERELIMNGR